MIYAASYVFGSCLVFAIFFLSKRYLIYKMFNLL